MPVRSRRGLRCSICVRLGCGAGRGCFFSSEGGALNPPAAVRTLLTPRVPPPCSTSNNPYSHPQASIALPQLADALRGYNGEHAEVLHDSYGAYGGEKSTTRAAYPPSLLRPVFLSSHRLPLLLISGLLFPFFVPLLTLSFRVRAPFLGPLQRSPWSGSTRRPTSGNSNSSSRRRANTQQSNSTQRSNPPPLPPPPTRLHSHPCSIDTPRCQLAPPTSLPTAPPTHSPGRRRRPHPGRVRHQRGVRRPARRAGRGPGAAGRGDRGASDSCANGAVVLSADTRIRGMRIRAAVGVGGRVCSFPFAHAPLPCGAGAVGCETGSGGVCALLTARPPVRVSALCVRRRRSRRRPTTSASRRTRRADIPVHFCGRAPLFPLLLSRASAAPAMPARESFAAAFPALPARDAPRSLAPLYPLSRPVSSPPVRSSCPLPCHRC